jgi:hypothetical protein
VARISYYYTDDGQLVWRHQCMAVEVSSQGTEPIDRREKERYSAYLMRHFVPCRTGAVALSCSG